MPYVSCADLILTTIALLSLDFPSLRNSSPRPFLRCRIGGSSARQLLARRYRCGSSNPCVSPIPCATPSNARNSFRFRTYEKHARNPFRIRTSKTQHLKPFRMNTYEKTPRGATPFPSIFFSSLFSWELARHSPPPTRNSPIPDPQSLLPSSGKRTARPPAPVQPQPSTPAVAAPAAARGPSASTGNRQSPPPWG